MGPARPATAGNSASGRRTPRAAGLRPLGAVLVLLLSLAGCGSQPWNDPYPDRQAGENILYSSFTERPKTLDPAQSYSSNEAAFTGQIYEPPLQYHYLKRPYQLEPLTVTALPEPVLLDAQGHRLPADAPAEQVAYSVYDIHLRPGILYQPHPAFARDAQGRPLYQDLRPADLEHVKTLADFPVRGTRELIAADYVYEIKRLASPRLHSPIYGLMSKYIVGLKELGATLRKASVAARRDGGGHAWLDLSKYPLEGAQVVDRYTYRIKVRGRYPQLKYWLAMPFFAPVPREADRFYSQPGMRERNITLDWYPVGTGPYMLTVNDPNRQMVLERNPNFHPEYYPREGEPGDRAAGLLRDAGKRLPFVDRVVYSLEKESIPYWNKFLQGYYDVSGVTSDSFDQAIQFSSAGDAELTPAMRKKGIELQTAVQTSIFYTGFNMLDPVVGGYSERARKLRQAISIAIDYEEYISIFANGRGVPAQGPLPPGIFGHVEGKAGIDPYVYSWAKDHAERRPLADARRLLAEAGYPGGRDARTGQPLLIHLDITAGGPEDKAYLDWLRKQFRRIDLELVIRNTDYNRFQEKMRKGNAQLFTWGWNADYPDPENFLFLLYGPNGKAEHGGENAANYDNPQFNRLFEQMATMENGPRRMALIRDMVRIAQRDAPWVWGMFPKQFVLHHAWYFNSKPNLMANNTLKYKRIDPAMRERLRAAWNQPVVWPFVLLAAVLLGALLPAAVMYRRKEQRRGLQPAAARATAPNPGADGDEDIALSAREEQWKI